VVYRKGVLKNIHSARISIPSQIRKDGDEWVWRVDLSRTDHLWPSWFKGMSKAFVSCACPKALVLAGSDRLDKELMIAQMQGKFQVKLLPKSGHVIMEDQPEEVAEVLLNFMARYKLLPPDEKNDSKTFAV